MTSRSTIITAALLMTPAGAILAHDGHEDVGTIARLRTWTHASGEHHVHASFVSARDDRVQVRKEDGSLLDLQAKALSAEDRQWVRERLVALRALNGEPVLAFRFPEQDPQKAPAQLDAFKPFADSVKVRWDRDHFYVESNGIPDHRLMVGITAWQQQVPLPQSYKGENAWRVPLRPVPAKKPMSAKENFFRGAIALAINGVPIFNPIKNDGRTDTFVAGELDEFGGHCGRADDYHYHIAPVHLEEKVGRGRSWPTRSTAIPSSATTSRTARRPRPSTSSTATKTPTAAITTTPRRRTRT